MAPQSPEERKDANGDMLQAPEAVCGAALENMLCYKDVLDFLRQKLHLRDPVRSKLLESVIQRPPPISDRRKLDYFLFEIGLSFAFRDE